ncbi:MAG: hypothetical protein CR997_02955 [Acidobacteria bacterium]|nr:MAG: hypothetical protein CR997_02955 [Acidobacteriota bacterium]
MKKSLLLIFTSILSICLFSLPAKSQVLKGLDPKDVKHFERVYSVKLKNHTLRGLKRSGRFMPAIESVFSEYGIPADIGWIVLVESNFNETARSPAAACGLFQFIAPTARGYNLYVDGNWPDWFIDERLEFYYACHASASFLSELYSQFGDWVTALAAYNTGPGNVKKAMKRAGGSRKWLDYRKYLAKETQEYTNRIAAVINIANNPQKFGLDPEYLPYIPFTLYITRKPTSLNELAERFGKAHREQFKHDFLILNRQFNEKILKSGRKIPKGYVAKLPEISVIAQSSSADHKQTKPATPTPQGGYLHLVEEGEDLAMLAFIYRIAQQDIVKNNPFIENYKLQAGIKLNLNLPESVVSRGQVVQAKAGDTVGSIVMRLRINGSHFVKLNNLHNSRLTEGERYYVPK